MVGFFRIYPSNGCGGKLYPNGVVYMYYPF